MNTIYINDSMSTIQEKINKSEIVTFSKGIYRITKQLTIPQNTIIDLNNATLRRCGSIQSIFLNKVTSQNKQYNAAGNITIKNGIFEGMGGYTYDNLITFFHSHDIIIENCKFLDSLCHSIEINSSNNVTIKNCKFEGYNLQSKDYTYRELIQIDHAGASAFFLSGSTKTAPCYDGTHCSNIIIENNIFTKSNNRDYPYACIGTHTQLYKGGYHKDIQILNNQFYCKMDKEIKQPCLSIIGMKNVNIQNNYFECPRVSRIYSKTNSYTLAGASVTPEVGDGHCSNITIANNTIKGCANASEAFIQSNKTNKAHTIITKTKNKYI